MSTAESIFENIAEAFGTTPCGGVWWDKVRTIPERPIGFAEFGQAETYVNAIGELSRRYGSVKAN